ncbi:hypothetical protein ACTMU2_33785 [Cupriavidus basilensis]
MPGTACTTAAAATCRTTAATAHADRGAADAHRPARPWHGFAKLWREPEPPDFHWRLLRYFCWTRVAVGLLLLAYTIMERGAETHGVSVVLAIPACLARPHDRGHAAGHALPGHRAGHAGRHSVAAALPPARAAAGAGRPGPARPDLRDAWPQRPCRRPGHDLPAAGAGSRRARQPAVRAVCGIGFRAVVMAHPFMQDHPAAPGRRRPARLGPVRAGLHDRGAAGGKYMLASRQVAQKGIALARGRGAAPAAARQPADGQRHAGRRASAGARQRHGRWPPTRPPWCCWACSRTERVYARRGRAGQGAPLDNPGRAVRPAPHSAHCSRAWKSLRDWLRSRTTCRASCNCCPSSRAPRRQAAAT